MPSARRDTTALVVRAGGTSCLVDVGGSPVQKLRRLDVDPLAFTVAVVTAHARAARAVFGRPVAVVEELRWYRV